MGRTLGYYKVKVNHAPVTRLTNTGTSALLMNTQLSLASGLGSHSCSTLGYEVLECRCRYIHTNVIASLTVAVILCWRYIKLLESPESLSLDSAIQ